MEGELLKLGSLVGCMWHRRYFKICANEFMYWKCASDSSMAPKRSIKISLIMSAHVAGSSGEDNQLRRNTIIIHLHRDKPLRLIATDPKEAYAWVSAIRLAKAKQECDAATQIQSIFRRRLAAGITACMKEARCLDEHLAVMSPQNKKWEPTVSGMKWTQATNFAIRDKVWVLDVWPTAQQNRDMVKYRTGPGPHSGWQSQWRLATVLAVDATANRVKVHFQGWSSKCDTWIDMKTDHGACM